MGSDWSLLRLRGLLQTKRFTSPSEEERQEREARQESRRAVAMKYERELGYSLPQVRLELDSSNSPLALREILERMNATVYSEGSVSDYKRGRTIQATWEFFEKMKALGKFEKSYTRANRSMRTFIKCRSVASVLLSLLSGVFLGASLSYASYLSEHWQMIRLGEMELPFRLELFPGLAFICWWFWVFYAGRLARQADPKKLEDERAKVEASRLSVPRWEECFLKDWTGYDLPGRVLELACQIKGAIGDKASAAKLVIRLQTAHADPDFVYQLLEERWEPEEIREGFLVVEGDDGAYIVDYWNEADYLETQT